MLPEKSFILVLGGERIRPVLVVPMLSKALNSGELATNFFKGLEGCSSGQSAASIAGAFLLRTTRAI